MIQFEHEMVILMGLNFNSYTKVPLYINLERPESSYIRNIKRSIILSSYFIIIGIILIIVASINNHNVGALTANELLFTTACIFPFAIIMFWVPHSIWDISESFQVRDELIFTFIGTSS